MASRPVLSVFGTDGSAAGTTKLPAVFTAPIRPDVVHFVHRNMSKNKRQCYAVARNAGKQTAAESWGTGRAVSRIPRVPGGGTHRAGQAAFGNMCRGGRMFNPNVTWRRWHRKTPMNMKRYAVCSALAASALPALVMARGHKIDNLSEVPLVVSSDAEAITKTANAAKLLSQLACDDDLERVANSRQVRAGQGKMRNRRFTMRRGPLVVYKNDNGISKSFRNIPGVELAEVSRLNLLQLAPGGHLGRFIVWTQAAVDSLDALYGTHTKLASQKKGYRLPRAMVSNCDIARVINSDEIQSVIRPARAPGRYSAMKKNPLKNLGALLKLNPYAKATIRASMNPNAFKTRKSKTSRKRHQVEGPKFFNSIKV